MIVAGPETDNKGETNGIYHHVNGSSPVVTHPAEVNGFGPITPSETEGTALTLRCAIDQHRRQIVGVARETLDVPFAVSDTRTFNTPASEETVRFTLTWGEVSKDGTINGPSISTEVSSSDITFFKRRYDTGLRTGVVEPFRISSKDYLRNSPLLNGERAVDTARRILVHQIAVAPLPSNAVI